MQKSKVPFGPELKIEGQYKIQKFKFLKLILNSQLSTLNFKGFTLIETIIVLAIIMTIGSSVTFATSALLNTNNLKDTTGKLVSTLRTAQTNSASGKEDSKWGVSVSSNLITLYKGDSYGNRDPAFDVSYTFPSTVTLTTADIVFDKVSGNTAATYTIQVSSTTDSATVTVNPVGTVNIL